MKQILTGISAPGGKISLAEQIFGQFSAPEEATEPVKQILAGISAPGNKKRRISAPSIISAWKLLFAHHDIKYHPVCGLHSLRSNLAEIADCLLYAVFNDAVI